MDNLNSNVQTLVIDDFSKTSGDSGEIFATSIYNMDNRKLTLNGNLGIKSLYLPKYADVTSEQVELNYADLNLQYIDKVMYFKQYFSNNGATTHRLLLHGSDNKIYLNEMFCGVRTLSWAFSMTFNKPPVVLAYKKDGLDAIIMSGGGKSVVWATNQVPREIVDVPDITSMCIHNEVLYCTIVGENFKIWYTTNLDPESIGTESSSTKFITLGDERGACRKVITFKENVYVFRDYGISKLNVYAKNEPTYSQIYLSNSIIYGDTVTVCGDTVMFMTRDGLYRFNGATVSKVSGLDKLIGSNVNDNAVATVLQNKYYLALNIDFDDGQQILCETGDYKNNALIVLDLEDYSFQVMRGVDIRDMLSLKADIVEKVIVVFNSQNKNKVAEITNDGKYFGQALPKYFSSNYITQKDLSKITIRKIYVDASANIKIKLSTDLGSKTFITYKDGINEFQTILPCSKFKFEVISSQNLPYINLLKINYVVHD